MVSISDGDDEERGNGLVGEDADAEARRDVHHGDIAYNDAVRWSSGNEQFAVPCADCGRAVSLDLHRHP